MSLLIFCGKILFLQGHFPFLFLQPDFLFLYLRFAAEAEYRFFLYVAVGMLGRSLRRFTVTVYPDFLMRGHVDAMAWDVRPIL